MLRSPELAPKSGASGAYNSEQSGGEESIVTNRRRNDGTPMERERRKERRKQRGEQLNASANSKSKEGSSSSQSGSVIWTLLVIGLVFCLVDVAYIMEKVETYEGMMSHPVLQNAIGNDFKAAAAAKAIESENAKEDTSHLAKAALSTSDEQKETIADGDKTYILNLLEDAGIPIDPIKEKDLYDELPTWQEVVSMYGDKPVIHGLDLCEDFQAHSDPADHFVSTAGTFNTGTNLMAELLIANCHMPARMAKYGVINRGVRWQVPWGKHTPPGDDAFRLAHKTDKDKDIDANNILPAVTIRDPLVWLGSMCKHEYAAHWKREPNGLCPNFSSKDLSTYVQYSDFKKYHDSILHLWNDYYEEYMNVKFHRLIVRFEDLIFHAKEVTETVCHCAGGAMKANGKFKYIVTSAKKGAAAHGKVRTGFLDAIVRYGNAARRYNAFKRRSDLEYIRDNVDKEIMETMQYPMPDVTRFD